MFGRIQKLVRDDVMWRLGVVGGVVDVVERNRELG